MQNFEIEESKERKEDDTLTSREITLAETLDIEDHSAPLDPTTVKGLPLEFLTKGMKPSVLKNRAMFVLIVLPMFFFLSSCLFTGFQIYWTHKFNLKSPYKSISAILFRLQDSNCNFKMITDILPVPEDQPCPSEYNNAFENIGVWNGTTTGCYYESTEVLNVGECPLKADKTIKSTAPIPLYSWRGNKFCTKALPGYAQMVKSQSNDKRYKRCAAEPRDFDIPKDEDCPINDVQIIPDSKPTPHNYTARKLQNGNKLVFSNDPVNYNKLVDLNSELFATPCLNPLVSPKIEGSLGYPLLVKKEEGCGEYGNDMDTKELDRMDALEFYNASLLSNVQKLPRWEFYNEGKSIVLFAKYRDRMKKNCNVCTEDTSLYPSAMELTLASEYMESYVIITAVILVFQFFLVVYNLMKYFDLEENYKAILDDVIYINVLFYVGNVIYFGVHVILAYLDWNNLERATDHLKEIETNNCFINDKINTVFDDVRGKILENSKDIMQDCMKAECWAIACALFLIVASYVTRNLLEKEEKSIQSFQEEYQRPALTTVSDDSQVVQIDK